MAEHTPGGFTIARSECGCIVGACSTDCLEHEGLVADWEDDGLTVERVPSCGGVWECAEHRLALAAPDLLAACEVVVREWLTCAFCGEPGTTACDCDPDSVAPIVRAAIAKARGESEVPRG